MAEELMVEYQYPAICRSSWAGQFGASGGLYGRQQMRLGMTLLFFVNGLNLSISFCKRVRHDN